MQSISSVLPMSRKPAFAGRYTLSVVNFPEAQMHLDAITRQIQARAQARKLALCTKDEMIYLGMGDSELRRHFLTGADAEIRRLEQERRQAMDQAVEKARVSADRLAVRKFLSTLQKEFARLARKGIISEELAQSLHQRIKPRVRVTGLDKPDESLSRRNGIVHNLAGPYVIRGRLENGDVLRIRLPEAINTNGFDIEAGEFSPELASEQTNLKNVMSWYWEPAAEA